MNKLRNALVIAAASVVAATYASASRAACVDQSPNPELRCATSPSGGAIIRGPNGTIVVSELPTIVDAGGAPGLRGTINIYANRPACEAQRVGVSFTFDVPRQSCANRQGIVTQRIDGKVSSETFDFRNEDDSKRDVYSNAVEFVCSHPPKGFVGSAVRVDSGKVYPAASAASDDRQYLLGACKRGELSRNFCKQLN